MIEIKKEGRRYYLHGLPFSKKDEAKHLIGLTGDNFDRDKKLWWFGEAKLEKARKAIATLNQGVLGLVEATPASVRAAASVGLPNDTPAGIVADALGDAGNTRAESLVRGSETVDEIRNMRALKKVNYKNQPYIVVAESRDGKRCRLTNTRCMAPFWVDTAACTLVRVYQPHEMRITRGYSRYGGTRTVHQTVGNLADYAARQKRPETARIRCQECDSWHDADARCSNCGGC